MCELCDLVWFLILFGDQFVNDGEKIIVQVVIGHLSEHNRTVDLAFRIVRMVTQCQINQFKEGGENSVEIRGDRNLALMVL